MRRFVVAGVAIGAVVMIGNHNNQTEVDPTQTAVSIAVEAGGVGESANQQPEKPSEPKQVDDGYQPIEDAERQFVGLFRSCGATHGIDPALLAAVAMVESSFRIYPEKSHAGAEGLMQFMPNTAKSMGVDPYKGFADHLRQKRKW